MAGAEFTAFEVLSVGTSSTGFTAATYGSSDHAHVTVEGTAVRFRMDGSAPTSTTGSKLEVGDVLILQNKDEVSRIRFISATGSTASLHTNFGKAVA